MGLLGHDLFEASPGSAQTDSWFCVQGPLVVEIGVLFSSGFDPRPAPPSVLSSGPSQFLFAKGLPHPKVQTVELTMPLKVGSSSRTMGARTYSWGNTASLTQDLIQKI